MREKAIADQFEARRAKNKASRERKAARREERLTAVSWCWAGVRSVWRAVWSVRASKRGEGAVALACPPADTAAVCCCHVVLLQGVHLEQQPAAAAAPPAPAADKPAAKKGPAKAKK